MDLESAKQALINTNATGDLEAAREIANYLSSQDQQPNKEPLYGGGQVSNLRAGLAGVGDTATFGFGDELKAGLQTGVHELAQTLGFKEDILKDETYDYFINKARSEQEQLQEENPYAYGGGQIGGAIGTGVLGGGLLQGTKAATLLPTVGKARYATSAGLGGVSGGFYGLGTGEGDIRERAGSAGIGAAFGIGGGLVGAGLGALGSRALKAFSKKSQPVIKEMAEETLPISGKPALQPVEDLVEKGQATSMLKGAKTQDIPLMRSEEMARQGLLGQELETTIRQADEAFKQSVKDTAQALAGSGTEETAQDTLTKAVGLVKNRFIAQKKLQGKLMDARNDAIAKASVYADYTKDTLGKALKELKATPTFKVGLMREENAPVMQDFKILNKLIGGKNTKSINMSALGAWRSGLNSYKPGTQQGVLSKQMADVYDDWLDNHLKLALKTGDEDLADTIFKANSRYSEFKTKYGTNKYRGQKAVIEKILQEDEMTPRAMVNTVFGKSMDGKDYTEQYVKRMVESMPGGAKRQNVIEGFRAGLYQKAFEDAFDATTDTLNFGKFKNNLIKMKKNDAFKKYLTTKKHDILTDELINDLTKYQRATSDRTIVNLSGTAPMATRIMQTFGALPVIRNISLARGGAEMMGDIAKSGARAKNKRQVEKSVSEFYKALAPQIEEQVKFRFGGQIAGGILGAQQGVDNGKD